MGLFNWLFSKHTPKPSQNDRFEVDIVSKTLYETVHEYVDNKQTAFDYVLENFGWVRDWYDNKYEQEHKKEHDDNRNAFKKELVSLDKPLFTINKNILVYEDSYVCLNKHPYSYRGSDISVSKHDLRPPVFRVVKDIYDNFCDWNYKKTSEYNFIAIKDLIVKERYSDALEPVNLYEYGKNGVIISWISTFEYSHWYDSKRKIVFGENEVDVSESELLLIKKLSLHIIAILEMKNMTNLNVKMMNYEIN